MTSNAFSYKAVIMHGSGFDDTIMYDALGERPERFLTPKLLIMFTQRIYISQVLLQRGRDVAQWLQWFVWQVSYPGVSLVWFTCFEKRCECSSGVLLTYQTSTTD